MAAKCRQKRSEDQEQTSLGLWMSNHKNSYTGSRLPLLSEAKVRKLVALAAWTFPTHHVIWAEMFAALRKWSDRAGQLLADTENVVSKTKWLSIGDWFAQEKKRSAEGFSRTDTFALLLFLRS